jgi:hypothetical protein
MQQIIKFEPRTVSLKDLERLPDNEQNHIIGLEAEGKSMFYQAQSVLQVGSLIFNFQMEVGYGIGHVFCLN